MPDIVIFIITMTLSIGGILYFIFSCIDGTLDYKASWLAIPLSLLVWIATYGATEWKYIDHTDLIVHKVDNIDVVKLNSELINLNDRFGRSFKDGEKITILEKSGEIYFGILPMEITNKYKLDSVQWAEEEASP